MKHCNHSMKWNFYNQRAICNTLYSTAHVIRQEENERFCDTCNAQGLLHDAKTTLIVFSNHLSVILKMVIIKDDGTHTTSFPCPGEVVTVLVRSTILLNFIHVLLELHLLLFYFFAPASGMFCTISCCLTSAPLTVS